MLTLLRRDQRSLCHGHLGQVQLFPLGKMVRARPAIRQGKASSKAGLGVIETQLLLGFIAA